MENMETNISIKNLDLSSGAVDVLIDQNPQLEIEAALRAIAGAFGRLDPPPGPTVTPVTILTRENC